MQSVSNGSVSYGNSYYGDPSVTLFNAAATNSTYADMLLQPTVVCYAPTYTSDVSLSTSCKQSQHYYIQEGSFGQQPAAECQNSPPTLTRYHEAGQVGGHHPGRAVQASSTSSSPSAAAAAAVAEATAALRQATSTPMFAVKPSQPGGFPLRGPTAEGIAVAARLAAGAAAAAADFAHPGSGYVQPGAVGLAGMTSSTVYGSTPSSFQLSSDEASASVHSGLHGFHPAANGFLPAAGTSGGAYSAFQKLQTPWTTSRMTMDAYPSLDACECLSLFLSSRG